jgi:hypothetical protein
MAKQAAIPPTLQPSTRADLERKRKGVLAVAPSGTTYRIRKVNLQRHVREGGLSTELKRIALKAVSASQNGGDPMSMMDDGDLEKFLEAETETKDYNDRIVLATVIEPPLSEEDLGTGELDDDPMLPPVDYDWLLGVAQGRIIRDAEDRMLWGPEPKHRMEVFQRHHSCDPATCKGCAAVVDEFTAVLAASQ